MEKNTKNEKSTEYSFLPEEKERFALRLKEAIGKESIKSIARDIGTSDGTLHHYLSGSGLPTLERLVALARRLKVSIGWLAIGEGGRLQDRPLEHKVTYDEIDTGDSIMCVRDLPPNATERIRIYDAMINNACSMTGFIPSDHVRGTVTNLLLCYPPGADLVANLFYAIMDECESRKDKTLPTLRRDSMSIYNEAVYMAGWVPPPNLAAAIQALIIVEPTDIEHVAFLLRAIQKECGR